MGELLGRKFLSWNLASLEVKELSLISLIKCFIGSLLNANNSDCGFISSAMGKQQMLDSLQEYTRLPTTWLGTEKHTPETPGAFSAQPRPQCG